MTGEETLATRLARLERDHRRLRTAGRIGAVVLVGVVLGVIECFRERADFRLYGLETTRVQILAPDGKKVSELGDHEGRTLFKFVDRNNKNRMFFALEAEGAALMLNDSAGRTRVRLFTKDSGGSLEFLDAEGQRVWSAPQPPRFPLVVAPDRSILVAP